MNRRRCVMGSSPRNGNPRADPRPRAIRRSIPGTGRAELAAGRSAAGRVASADLHPETARTPEWTGWQAATSIADRAEGVLRLAKGRNTWRLRADRLV